MAIVMDYIAKCGCRIRVDDIDGIRWRYAERLVRAQMAEEQARKEAGG